MLQRTQQCACTITRAVAKISRSQVYAFSRWETEQPEVLLVPFSFCFLQKWAGVMLTVARGNPQAPALSESPEKKKDTVGWSIEHNPS